MAITTRLPDKNPTINLLLRKIINITINYKWFILRHYTEYIQHNFF